MDIKITFEYKGHTYVGSFSKVTGGGSTGLFHLSIDQRYNGQLFKTSFGWRFSSQTGKFEELSEYFGKYIQAFMDQYCEP